MGLPTYLWSFLNSEGFVNIIFGHWLVVFSPVSLFRLQSGLRAEITETACTSVGKPDFQPEAPGAECHLLSWGGQLDKAGGHHLVTLWLPFQLRGVTGQHGQHRLPAVPIIISQVCLCLVVVDTQNKSQSVSAHIMCCGYHYKPGLGTLLVSKFGSITVFPDSNPPDKVNTRSSSTWM